MTPGTKEAYLQIVNRIIDIYNTKAERQDKAALYGMIKKLTNASGVDLSSVSGLEVLLLVKYDIELCRKIQKMLDRRGV